MANSDSKLQETMSNTTENINNDNNGASTQKKQWVFGYGSLINTKSRTLTYKTPSALACRIVGYKRRWNRPVSTPENLQPLLGVILTNKDFDTVNGVIYEVNDEMIKAFDERELKWGYTRNCVPISQIQFLFNNDLQLKENEDIVHYYELPVLYEQEDADNNDKDNKDDDDKDDKDNKNDNSNNNIECLINKQLTFSQTLQQYVDVCMLGCLEYGTDFAIEFVRTTFDWRHKWNVDRWPIQKKMLWNLHPNNEELIDNLLSTHIQKYHGFKPLHLQNNNNNDSTVDNNQNNNKRDNKNHTQQ